MLIEYIPTYKYFSNFTKFTDQTILDFGSNCGNLLKSGNITQEKYTGVDVDAEAIAEGMKLFPNANWIWYNRYNPVYNIHGDTSYPELTQQFDLVVSYSVFSHIAIDDAADLLGFLYAQLAPNSKILFSYCNIDNRTCVEWFREQNKIIYCDDIVSDDFMYLINNKASKKEPTMLCRHFVTFYKTSWLLDKLSRFNPVSYAPPKGWYQDCMILST